MYTFLGDTYSIIFALMIVLLVLIAQIICYKYDWKPRIDQMTIGKKRTYITMALIITVIFCNMLALLFQLSIHYVWPNCTMCNNGHIINRLLFVTIRCLNRLFFIQRAKLSQEIKPILADKCFDRILPLTVIFMYIIFITAIISVNIIDSMNNYNHSQCKEALYNEDYTKYQCINNIDVSLTDIIYIGSSIVAIVTSIVITFLFLRPICLIPSIPSDMFSNSKQTRKQYKTICYNVCLSIINLLSSQFIISVWSLYPQIFWFMPSIDNTINSVTIYLMIGRNRQWNKKIYYYVIETLCCKRIVFSHQNENRLSKDGKTKSQFERNIDVMIHGDIKKIRNIAPSITPNVIPTKQRLSTFISEIELKWKSDDEIFRERNSKDIHHQYTASDNANINIANLNKLRMKSQEIDQCEPKSLVSTYNQTRTKDIITNTDIYNDDDDDAISFDPVITHLITMEEDEDEEIHPVKTQEIY